MADSRKGRPDFSDFRDPGTARRERGFTLVELLIVMVILGILAAIAVPQYASTRENASDAAAMTDLRNLMNVQELYYERNGEYASSVSELSSEESVETSEGVSVSLVSDDTQSYGADASHESTPHCFRVEVGRGGAGQIVRVADASSGDGECGG